MSKKRPKSACEVAQRANNGESFDILLREFLDTWYLSHDKPGLIREEPPTMADEKRQAYLVATCRQLALEYEIPAPRWCVGIKHRLEDPWFPANLPQLRPWLIYSSPPAFKMLNIFPGENPLFRPLKLQDKDRHGSRYMPSGFETL